jgi:hypothetical protein
MTMPMSELDGLVISQIEERLLDAERVYPAGR